MSRKKGFQYKPHEKYIYVNDDDKDLFPIKINLPDPPPLHKIDGYGLEPHKQMWRSPQYPHRLRQLESNKKDGRYLSINDIWEYLSNNQKSYEEEITWIKKQWYHRLNGYWFFNNGVPTYITGKHYYYLAFWNLDVGLPQYRYRDRLFFLFEDFCLKDTFAVKMKFNDMVKRYEPEINDGELTLYDTGNRVCLGFIYPKHRREGATSKAAASGMEICTSTKEAYGGFQSMDGGSGEKLFQKKIVPGFKKLPFFFKPTYDGSTNPKRELVFDVPGIRIGGRGSIGRVDTGLESRVDYAESAGRGWYDGEKLYFYLGDEEGKMKEENCDERWQVVNKCLAQGEMSQIHGFSLHTTTVGEVRRGGGQAFFELCKKSHYQERTLNGTTKSGLYILFIPAYVNLDGFTDRYGNAIVGDPEPDQIKDMRTVVRINGRVIGAREYLQNKKDALLEDGTQKALTDYYELVRQFPTSFSECFITDSSDSGFPMKIIEDRLSELRFEKNITVRGNLSWKDDIIDGRVIFTENENGKFVISKLLPDNMSNRKYHKGGIWSPLDGNEFTSSSDAFKFRKTESKRMSNGGGAVKWEYDPNIDEGKDSDQWESDRIVCTYNNRPPTIEEFCEDMLMMSVYYNARHYPEINVPIVWEYFEKRGYSGYLLYGKDELGKFRNTPGFNSGEKMKQLLFSKTRNYLELNGRRERHIEYLQECKDVGGIENMTDFDLFTACGGCHLGSEQRYGEIKKITEEQEKSIQRQYFKKYKY